MSNFEVNAVGDPGILEKLDALRGSGGAVQAMRFNGELAHLVLGYAAVDTAFKNTADLPSSTFYKLFTREFFGFIVSTADGDEHRFHRLQLMPAFTPTAVRAMVQDVLYPTANALIDSFPIGQPFDFIHAYAEQFSFNAISALLDVPYGDRQRLRENVRRVFDINNVEQALAARDQMIGYVRDLVAQRRASPRSDLISRLAAAETSGRRFTDDELIDAVRFLYPAAQHNTTNGLGLCLHAVLSRTDLQQRVNKSEEDRVAAVEEALRLAPPMPLLARYTDRPITVEGVDIPANSYVLLAIASANRDPAHYPDPTVFSLDRKVKDHLAFGRGANLCIGLHLARAEMRVTLELMLRRLHGLRLVPSADNQAAGGLFYGFERLLMQFDARMPT